MSGSLQGVDREMGWVGAHISWFIVDDDDGVTLVTGCSSVHVLSDKEGHSNDAKHTGLYFGDTGSGEMGMYSGN
jgi:hypothetical protein